MTTRVLIRAGKRPQEPHDPFTVLARNTTGCNVGNMLFSQSVFKTLSLPDHELAANGLDLGPKHAGRINAECDLLVLPLANAFRPEFHDRLDLMADAVRRLKVPVLVLGVGCQTGLDRDLSRLDGIRRPARRFVSAVLDRSATIGVRGECTADFVRSLGFRDVEVIGCPSMFMHGPALPEPRRVPVVDRSTRVTVSVSAANDMAAFSTGLERLGQVIARTVAEHDDVDYVPQENASLEGLLLGRDPRPSEHDVVPEAVYRAMLDAGRVTAFVDPRTWLAHLGTRDFALGTRLHGAVAAVLAGTPAHLIAHDSRTLELAEHHQLPHSRTSDLDASSSAAQLLEKLDTGPMLAGHAQRFTAYADFLRRNGVRNVYSDGDGGAAFERELAAAELAGPVGPVPVVPEVLERMRWLDAHWARQRATTTRGRGPALRAAAQGVRAARRVRRRVLG